MSEIEAQDTFVHVLLQICPHFAAHLEANDILPCQNSMDLYVKAVVNYLFLYVLIFAIIF